MKVIELKIKGLTCSSCSASVEKLVDQLSGISSRKVSHETNSGLIKFDEAIISEHELIAKINEGHYKVDLPTAVKTKPKIEIPLCPNCKQSGALVPNTIFKSNLKVESYHKVDLDIANYICLNPECNTAYYDKGRSNIEKTELKRELWFKNGSKTKIICYCNNISKEQIKEAIVNQGISSWEDITSFYRKKVIEKCELLNPTGYCCRKTFDKVANDIKTSLINQTKA